MHAKISLKDMDIEEHLIWQLPGLFYIKDLNSRFIAINQQTLKLFGFNEPSEIINRTDYHIQCDAARFATHFINEDKSVIQSNKALSVIYVLKLADGNIYQFLATKTPLIDVKSSRIRGVICQGTNLAYHQSLANHMLLISERNDNLGCYYGNDNFKEDISLTKTQQVYLFYILRGKTAKEISRILNVSIRTSQAHFENLKVRFNCQHKSELIDKAIRMGYLKLLPGEYLATFKNI